MLAIVSQLPPEIRPGEVLALAEGLGLAGHQLAEEHVAEGEDGERHHVDRDVHRPRELLAGHLLGEIVEDARDGRLADPAQTEAGQGDPELGYRQVAVQARDDALGRDGLFFPAPYPRGELRDANLDEGELGREPWPSPNGGRLVHGLPGFQRFDSLAVEDNGNVCVATLVKGGIHVFAPDGRLLEFHEAPEGYCTNLCFGGPEMRTAYITLSGHGQLFEAEWPRPGLRLAF